MHNSSQTVDIEKLSFAAPPVIRGWHRRMLIVGAVGLIASIIGFVLNPTQAIQSYLVGFVLVVGLTTGPLGFLCLWHMTGGKWGIPMRRIWEAGTRNIWFAALAFIPVLIGYKRLFPWADQSTVDKSSHLYRLMQHYLNFHDFLLRGVIYFAVWAILIYFLNKWSAQQDGPHDRQLTRRIKALSAGGELAYVWAVSLASVDWLMSLTPGWPSTVFPLILVVGQGLLGLALGIIVGRLLINHEPMNVLMDAEVFHDNGKLLLAFVMLWAYLSYSQWLVYWAGNLPEEIRWFMDRVHGGWGGAALFLAVFYFCVPFCFLLSRGLKRDVHKLVWVALWLVFMRYWDLYWITQPTWHKEHFNFNVWDAIIPITMVAIWAALFFRNLASRPLVALHDPELLKRWGTNHE